MKKKSLNRKEGGVCELGGCTMTEILRCIQAQSITVTRPGILSEISRMYRINVNHHTALDPITAFMIKPLFSY